MMISEILDELGIQTYPEKSRPGWVTADCPFCGKPGKPGLGIPSESRRIANCWSCGVHSLVDALTELSSKPWREVKELLGHADETEPRRTVAAKRLSVPDGVGQLRKAHEEYLRSRRYSPSVLEKLWGIQGIGIAARLSWHIFIPAQKNGRMVSWTSRSISETKKPKYVNARPDEEAVPIKSLLYGADLARHAVVVVEGPTDAWRVGPGAVATLGTNVTRAQVAKIANFPVRAVVFDSEPIAQEKARELCDHLSCLPGKTLRVELDAADPGSASKREVKLLRRMIE